ncbi:MAG: zinc-binding dehydrogenase [Caldilineaceae bacterium]|nr:zinc-binding dehydrogenase [Caldilineaceae bacterium]
MRAIAFDRHDPAPDVYYLDERFPTPEPAPDEVLVRVAYAALNRLDNFVRIGWRGLTLDFPHIPCSDFSGEIVAVGTQVRDWRPGQRVTANPLIWCNHCRACLRGQQNRCRRGYLMGEHVRGTCAEYVTVPARNLVEVPAGYDLRLAAAASLVYLTAWHNLIVAGNLRAGERVLVVGAGGGVNTASIQVARLAGASVYVVASSADKAARARALGAEWTHDRSQDPDWSRAVYLATGREGVDMVVDNVGQATWPDSLRTLGRGGRLVTVGGTAGYEAAVPVNLLFGRHLSIIGSTMGTQDDYLTVMELVFQGKLQPVVDSVYSLESFHEAVHRMLHDDMFGKILIAVHPEER